MIYNTYQELIDKLNELLKENKELKITLTKANRIIKDLQNRGDDKVSAKEMFEKLGYELFFNMSQCLWYIKDVNGIKYNVRFNTIDDKFIDIWYIFEKQRKDFNINLELLQAINKQVEELGWNNESKGE